jgi:hypothetical protein
MIAVGGMKRLREALSPGHRIIDTMGHSITLLSNSKGLSIGFSTATRIVPSARFRNAGQFYSCCKQAVIGVRLEKDRRRLNFQLLFHNIYHMAVGDTNRRPLHNFGTLYPEAISVAARQHHRMSWRRGPNVWNVG